MTEQTVSINKGTSLYIEGMVANVYDGVLGLWKISPGRCRDSNNVMDIELNLNPNNDFYMEGEIVSNLFCGPGGADLQSNVFIAGTIYAIYVIADSSGKNRATSLCSVDNYNNIPTLPHGYDSYRLIGYTKTSGMGYFSDGNINTGTRNNRSLVYLNSQQVTNTPSVSLVEQSLIDFVPNVDNVYVTFGIYYTGTSTTHSLQFASVNALSEITGYIQTQANNSVIYQQWSLTCPVDVNLEFPAPAFFYMSGVDDIPSFVVEEVSFSV